jgi:MraZ protein
MLTWGRLWVCLGGNGDLWSEMVLMLLTGTFARSLDDKQRFAIPKPLREGFGGSTDLVLYLAPGTDKSLALYSEETFTQLANQLGNHSPNAQETRAFSRLFYAQAQRVDVDRQGRVRLPTELAQWADLDKEVILLGVRDHLEVWNPDRWECYLAEKQAQYDALAESAFAGPGSPPAASSDRREASHSPDESATNKDPYRPSRPR